MPLSKLDNKSYYIPSKPEVLIALQKIMSHEEPELLEISNLVASDIGLAAEVLQTINSPVFGMNRVISDIKQAVMFIGLDAIYAIVQGHALKNSFRSKSCISLERFWDEINLVANAMCFIGQKVKEKIPIETLYAIGLFHDCGIAAFATNYDDYKAVLLESNNNGYSQIALEQERYNTDHAIIGYYIASSWNLPKELCKIILVHHETDFLDSLTGEEEQISYAVLKAAEDMVSRTKMFKPSIEWPSIEQSIYNVLGIDEEEYYDLVDIFQETLNT